jgi:DNA invertase Pin-like site-specific DNA recombinase
MPKSQAGSPKGQTKRKAYSYVRFSTPEQMRGDSFRRQSEMSERYAREHGLQLDDLNFQDLGKSAYRGGNKKAGLGELLEAVKVGAIEQNSVVLIENLDRLSRETARKALRTLESIVDEGVSVVTLSDGREYTKQNLDEDPTSLLLSILVFMRANDESKIKSQRVRAAWGNKRAGAATKVLTKAGPAWLKLVDGKWQLLPDRVKIVREIFQRVAEGEGVESVAASLNDRDEPTWKGERWHRSYLWKTIVSKAPLGIFQPHTFIERDGKRVREPIGEAIDGYFPSIVSEELWLAANAGRAEPQPHSGKVRNILSGLGRCPLCGATATRKDKSGPKDRAAGRELAYLVCAAAASKAGCRRYLQARADHVEEAIRTQLGKELDGAPDANEAVQRRQEMLRTSLETVQEHVNRIVHAIEEGGESIALRERLDALSGEAEEIEKELEELETLTPKLVTQALSNLMDAIPDGTTEQINTCLRRVFSKAVIEYAEGTIALYWKHAPEASPARVQYAWPGRKRRRRK